MSEGSGSPESTEPQASRNPTEGSKGFLNKLKERALNNKFKVLTHTVGIGLLAHAAVDATHGNYGAAFAKGVIGAFSIAFTYAGQGGWR